MRTRTAPPPARRVYRVTRGPLAGHHVVTRPDGTARVSRDLRPGELATLLAEGGLEDLTPGPRLELVR